MPLTLKVQSLPEDKPKIAFYAAMMAIQNYGFYQAYYALYPNIPVGVEGCDDIRFWVGCFALDCAVESFCCVWMAMGGYIDSCHWFAFGWVLHLVVAIPYCIFTLTIPLAVFSDEGETCRLSMGPYGDWIVSLYWTHFLLFNVYVWMMLSITYYSFLKPSFPQYFKLLNKSQDEEPPEELAKESE